jgi:hypothetical protein
MEAPGKIDEAYFLRIESNLAALEKEGFKVTPSSVFLYLFAYVERL